MSGEGSEDPSSLLSGPPVVLTMARADGVAALMSRLIPVPRHIADITQDDEYHVYSADLTVRGYIRRRDVLTVCPITYEVGPRDLKLGTNFTPVFWRKQVMGGPVAPVQIYPTPEAHRNTLLQFKNKHTIIPPWDGFNFDGMVTALGGMQASLSLNAELTTEHFREGPYRIKGVNQMSDLLAVMDRSAVFIDPALAPGGDKAAFWALVCAANVAGSDVVCPVMDADSDGRARCCEYGGARLFRGVSLALNLLASYYDAAGLGDVFALNYVHGIHCVVTVVGHSDEGGFMREVLRCTSSGQPFGGLPTGIPLCGGVPIEDGRMRPGSNVVVDTVALVSAAIVAHCDPMVNVDGDYYPTVLDTETQVDSAGNPLTPSAFGIIHAGAVYQRCDPFANMYCRGLAKAFGLSADAARPRAAERLICMFKQAADTGARHLEYPTVAPFFWIEPTCILPKHWLGTVAEQAGSGSLAGWEEVVDMPYLQNATRLGASDGRESDWAIDFRSARTLGMVLLCQNNKQDGLACLKLKGFTCDRIIGARLDPEAMRAQKYANGGIDLPDLLWTRGQSKIPHPAEVVNVDGRMAVTITHATSDANNHAQPIKTIPWPEDLADATITLRPSRLRYFKNGPRNSEDARVRRIRTQGTDALAQVYRDLLRSAVTYGTGALVAERPPRKAESGASGGQRERVEARNDRAPGEEVSAGLTAGEQPAPGGSTESAGTPQPVARQHGAITAPQPRDVAGGGGGGGGGRGDGPRVPSAQAQPSAGDGGAAPSAAQNQQGAAPSNPGAAASP